MTNKLIVFKKEAPKIKTIEKFEPDVIKFSNKEEFAEYLEKERENLNEISTCKLNKMFSITGYHITRIRGEIALKKSKDSTNDEQILEQTNDISAIKDTLNSLIKQLYEKGLIDI